MRTVTVPVSYPFVLCRPAEPAATATHLGLDHAGHPASRPGHPHQTLCGRRARPLDYDENPWEGRGEVDCVKCLWRSERFLGMPGWPSLATALAIFQKHHRERDHA